MSNHVLQITTRHCGMFSTCYYGSCACGDWEKGPHFMPETLQGYWADHVHLDDLARQDAYAASIRTEHGDLS